MRFNRPSVASSTEQKNCMHGNSTHSLHAGEMVVEQSIAVQIAGYVALLLFASVGAVMTLVSHWAGELTARTGTRMHLSNLWSRMRFYAFLLAALWLVAALNRLDWRRADDGALLSLSIVALNAAVWIVGLTEVLAYYLGYDGAPTHWTAYDTCVMALRAIVFVLAAVVLSTEAARFVALILVVPLSAMFAWAACIEAPDSRTLLRPEIDWHRAQKTLVLTRPRCAALALMGLGFVTLTLEMLTPSYGNVVSVGAAAWFALAEHCALCALLIYLSAGAGDLPPPKSSEPDNTAPSSSLLPTHIETVSNVAFGGPKQPDRATLIAGFDPDDNDAFEQQ